MPRRGSSRVAMAMYLAAAAGLIGVATVAAMTWGRAPREWKDGSPAWSPDGRRLAFYSERDGNAEIATSPIDATP
jgi:hypothetical protein